MATSGSFKKTARQSRNITVEDFFNKGMYVTEAALPTGQCGNLINLRVAPDTGHLISRKGMQPYDDSRITTADITDAVSYYPVRSALLINTEDDVHYITTLAAIDNENELIVPGIGGVKNKQAPASDAFTLLDYDTSLVLKKFKALDEGRLVEVVPNINFSLGPVDGVHIIKNMPAFNPMPEQLGCVLLNTFIGLNSGVGLYKYVVKPERVVTEDYVMQESIAAMEPDAAFALQYGYNMLSSAPYSFSNDLTANAISFDGLLPYKWNEDDPFGTEEPLKLFLTYRNGQEVFFQLFFKSGSTGLTKANLTAELRIGDSDKWEPQLLIFETSPDDDDYCTKAGIHIKVPADDFQIKVTSQDGTTVECVSIFSFSGGSDEDGVTKIETPNYDLTQAQGIFSWKRRVGLYGVPNAPNIVFLSDIDNPSYFPYPHNIIEYDYPVLKVINFLDDIMVFTTDGIYQTELGTDGNSFITKQTVGNIHLTPSDMYSVQTIKNMLFYKADNRYYMLVPSTRYSTLNQLQVAPISTPINQLLDNFEIEFRKILQAMYGDWINAENQGAFIDTFTTVEEEWRTDIIPTYYSSFVDGDLIKLNYGFTLNTPYFTVNILYVLIYDTFNKLWFSDIIELGDNEVLGMYRRSIIGNSQNIITDIQRLGDDSENTELKLFVGILQDAVDTNEDFNLVSKVLPTRQFLDTGFRDINAAWKKRFREIQFKLSTTCNNYTVGDTDVYNAYKAIYINPKFKIDNELRNDGSIYYVYKNDDTSLYYLGAKENYLVKFSDTHLETDDKPPYTYSPELENDLFFKLEDEVLTDATLSTLRFKTTGKGRCPRVQLCVHTNIPYELHNIAWVFRNMNAR